MFAILSIWFYLASSLDAAPTATRMVDLTHPFKNDGTTFPTLKPFEITVVQNGVEKKVYWVKSEEYSSSTHAGTHMDAPAHVTQNGKTVDQLPIERFVAPAAVIDITQKASVDPDAEVTVADLQNWESVTGQSLDGTIVLMRSGYGQLFDNPEAYLGTSGKDLTQLHYPGINPEAASWLVNNREIFGIGVDTVALDRGQGDGLKSHTILLGSGIFGLENMANLEDLPIAGAVLFVSPMKVKDGSGAPTRIFATVPQTSQ